MREEGRTTRQSTVKWSSLSLDAGLVRGLLALATALAGVMNVLSALFPAFHWRYLLLRDMVSVRIINDSTVATALLGILLILLAEGLARRHRRAMWLTLGILGASVILHLTKGLDYEEACICLLLGGALFARRRDYIVPCRPITLRGALPTVVSFGLLFYAYDLLGFRILSHWISPRPSLVGALLDPLRLIVDDPLYRFHGYQAHWFGGSLVFMGSVALAGSAMLILRPLIPIHLSSPVDRERARRIVHRFGHDTLSYFALHEDRAYFFSSDGDAFLSYRIWRNVALVGGDPIGPITSSIDLLRDFLQFCEANGLTPCFLGAGSRNLSLYQSLGLKVLKIGEESVIRLPGFEVAKLRRKVRRAERHSSALGITAEMYSATDVPDAYREQALEISKSWVATKGGSERGFSMTLGRFPRSDDTHARVLFAVQSHEVLGFLTFVPVFGAAGWSLDMMRRRSDAPNGLTEFMVLQAASLLKSQGFEFMSLNFAALWSSDPASRSPSKGTITEIPESRALRSLRRFLFENLSSVYQMKTLYQFNSKFEPEWSSRYLVYADIMRAPKVILAAVQAEDPFKLSTVAAVFRR